MDIDVGCSFGGSLVAMQEESGGQLIMTGAEQVEQIGINTYDPGSFTCQPANFGRAAVGTCRRGAVVCRNGGGRVRRVESIELQPAEEGFVSALDYELAITCQSTRSIPIDFCPVRRGEHRADFALRIDNGDTIRTTMRGTGE